MRRFAYEYGAHPLHLLVALAAFVTAAWALVQALDQLEPPGRFLLWLLGAIVLHDLVFLPAYSLLGRLGRAGLRPGDRLRIAVLNHLRVPAILSGLAFIVWYPSILAKSGEGFERVTALTKDPYLERWLLLSAALFLASALVLAVRARGLR